MGYIYGIVIAIVIVVCILAYSIMKFFNVGLNKEKITTKKITGAALLGAIEIVFIAISGYITIGPVNMNLSLVPIALGAMLYGPLVGGFLGLVNGLITIVSPSTLAIFMPINPLGTVIVCLLKTCLAGVIAGLVFKLFKNRQYLGSLISSLLVPVINTGLFSVGCYLFFSSWLNAGTASVGYSNSFMFLIYAVIGWNFVIELLISLLLSSSVYIIIKYAKRRLF